MPIKEPRIYVALTSNDGRTDLLVRRDDDSHDQTLRWVRINLNDAEREGQHALCQRLGSIMLYMLTQAHPQDTAQFPWLLPPELTNLERLSDLINNLIGRSAHEQTSAYVPALDAIFTRHATELTQTSLPEQWSTFRKAFLRHDKT